MDRLEGCGSVFLRRVMTDGKPSKIGSVPFKLLLWFIPTVFAAGMLWMTFRNLPGEVAAHDVAIATNRKATETNAHEVEITQQEVGYVNEALERIEGALSVMNESQRADARAAKRWRFREIARREAAVKAAKPKKKKRRWFRRGSR